MDNYADHQYRVYTSHCRAGNTGYLRQRRAGTASLRILRRRTANGGPGFCCPWLFTHLVEHPWDSAAWLERLGGRLLWRVAPAAWRVRPGRSLGCICGEPTDPLLALTLASDLYHLDFYPTDTNSIYTYVLTLPSPGLA